MRRLSFTLLCASTLVTSATAAPKIVTTIVPLHSLVSSLMEGVGTPELLMQGQNSEHNASFTPQQIADMEHADVVFMIGNNLEGKLGEISGTDTVGGKAFVKMNEIKGLNIHTIRQGGTWEADGDEPPPTPQSTDPHPQRSSSDTQSPSPAPGTPATGSTMSQRSAAWCARNSARDTANRMAINRAAHSNSHSAGRPTARRY